MYGVDNKHKIGWCGAQKIDDMEKWKKQKLVDRSVIDSK